MSTLAPLEASRIQIDKTPSPKEKLPNDKLLFGKYFSDHMLEMDWHRSTGWESPRVVPYHKLELDPAASVLHYGLECFEGMKAYKDAEGNPLLFRPDMNLKRLNRSMTRLGFPELDEAEALECLKTFVRTEQDWIPSEEGFSLYLRPTAISTHPFLGVGAADAVKVFVIASPVGPYYPTGFKPVTLLADTRNVRAWPGGVGDCKVGGNYAPTIRPQQLAAQQGYQQVLWLFGEEDGGEVTEVGTMNFFAFLRNADTGKDELVTPPLDGTILPGVTRDSVLALAREWGEFDVSERKVTMNEVTAAIDEGRLHECFGVGTAVVVSPIAGFHFNGRDYEVPLDPKNPDAGAGPLTKRFWDAITSIQYGRTPHPWAVKV